MEILTVICIAVLGVICNVVDCSPPLTRSTFLRLSRLNSFPDGHFPEYEELDIQYSSINELTTDVFNSRGFYNLKKATISSNLRIIQDGALKNMSNLILLNLNGNGITTIHENAFEGLVSLKYLHLGNNNIPSFSKHVLLTLPALISLDLANNAITTLSVDFLVGTKLRELNLEGNPLMPNEGPILESKYLESFHLQSCNINHLSPDAFALLPKLWYLDLSRNSFKVLPANLPKDNLQLQHLDYDCTITASNGKMLCSIVTRVELTCTGKINLDCTHYQNNGTIVPISDDNEFSSVNGIKQEGNLSSHEKGDDKRQGNNRSNATGLGHTQYAQNSSLPPDNSTTDADNQNVGSGKLPSTNQNQTGNDGSSLNHGAHDRNVEDQKVIKISFAIVAGIISCILVAIGLYRLKFFLLHRLRHTRPVTEQVPFIIKWKPINKFSQSSEV